MIGANERSEIRSWRVHLSEALPGRQTTTDADAMLGGLSATWIRPIMWVPLVGTVILAVIYGVHRRLFYWLLLEDHPVEWLQFTFLVFTVLAAGWAGIRLGRAGRLGLAVLILLAALGALALAGEEISWGERVFGLMPSADLAAINKQQELNLHNVSVGNVSFDKVSDIAKLLLGLGGGVLALLTRPAGAPFRSTWMWQIAPPLAAVPGFAFMAFYGTVMMGAGIEASPALVFQEWTELCFDLGIAVTAAGYCAEAALAAAQNPSSDRSGPRRLRRGARTRRRVLVLSAATSLVVTVGFARLTIESGILPGNVPPSLVELYKGF